MTTTYQQIKPGCSFEECSKPLGHKDAGDALCINENIGYVEIPHEPCVEIAPGLWQGGSAHEYSDPTLGEFDFIVSLFGDSDRPPHHVQEIIYHFADGDVPDAQDLYNLANQAWGRWRTGKKVLIRCFAGLNRSGLLMAMVLMLDGWTADAAINHIRKCRSKDALCNTKFTDWLKELQK